MESRNPKKALDDLFWREEILQVLFWMEGENLAESVGVAQLQSFLNGDSATIRHQLRRCCRQGLLFEDGTDQYRLTDQGRREGGRLFSDAFSKLQKQGHGECSSDCVCFTEGPANCPLHNHET